MNISRISVSQINLPLEHPFWLPAERLKFEMLDATLDRTERDERLYIPQDAARITRNGMAKVFGIKLNRVGGLVKTARLGDVALAQQGVGMFFMATGGTVLADAEAPHLAATVPDANCLVVWACQDMITVDSAAGRGPPNRKGHLHLAEMPGQGVLPDEEAIGELVAVYQ